MPASPSFSLTKSQGLGKILEAKSIAVVGASDEPLKISGRPISYMLRHGYRGTLYPVNPLRERVQGLKSYPSLTAIREPIDVALIATEASRVEAAIADGLEAGVLVYVVFSSGFAEVGPKGLQLQKRIVDLITSRGGVILGPNCLGVMNTMNGVMATFSSVLEGDAPKPGHMAIVSQSGAMAAYWLDGLMSFGLGCSKWITTGNEAGIDAAAAVDYLADDPQTRIIGLYLEDIRNADDFRVALARAARAGKAVIAIKSGRSRAGAAAANSHTGALAGDAALFDAFLAQHGVLRVNSLTEMNDVARLWLSGRPLQGSKIAIVSISGGAGVMLADAVDERGLEMAEFSDVTTEALRRHLPSFVKATNPVDLTATLAQEPTLLENALLPMVSDPNIDAIVVFLGLLPSVADALATALTTIHGKAKIPVLVVWMGAKPSAKAACEAAGMLVFGDIPRSVAALSAAATLSHLQQSVLRYSKAPLPRTDSGTIQSPEAAGVTLSEWESKCILAQSAAIHVPSGRLWRMSELSAIGQANLRYPLVAKLQARDLPHKSDVGAVIVHITDSQALDAAVAKLASIAHATSIGAEGILIEEMLAFDHELILGLRRDARFGPVMTLGRGGVAVELDPDVVTRLLPLDEAEVVEMIEGLRSARLFKGFRNKGAVDLSKLGKAVSSLANWFGRRPDLLEIEINPLAVRGQECWALDALATIAVGSKIT